MSKNNKYSAEELPIYPYRIVNQQLWDDFKERYKKKGLGKNLNQSITNLIKEFLEKHP